MGGGLMQLVAYGAQDIYLTGNPQITFFKVVYRRHTNFSMEEIAQTGSGNETLGDETTYTISRNGDLVHKMYVEINLGTIGAAVEAAGNLGHALLEEIECEIGGQKIDKHYGHWLTTWSDLTDVNIVGTMSALDLHADFIAETTTTYGPTKYQKMAGIAPPKNLSGNDSKRHFFIPLQFWFNRNPGLALPLIALQYHEVKIKIKYGSRTYWSSTSTSDTGPSPKLYAQYIYLDTDERRRFAQVSHEYLIEQLQFQNESAKSVFTLNFNHPVKEIIWRPESVDVSKDTCGATPKSDYAFFPFGKAHWQLKLNGHDRTSLRHITYYTRQQIYDYHTGYGSVTGDAIAFRGIDTAEVEYTSPNDRIAVYSFALKPEEHQPSGTCNFSRIDTAQLIVDITTSTGSTTQGGIYIYAINYNVLRIMSGMGGLAYSN